MKHLSIQLSGKPDIAHMRNGEAVTVLNQPPKPASLYPADKWVLIRMPDQSTRIIQRAALMLASRKTDKE